MTGRMRIAILDDYQNVATSFADWDSLDADDVTSQTRCHSAS